MAALLRFLKLHHQVGGSDQANPDARLRGEVTQLDGQMRLTTPLGPKKMTFSLRSTKAISCSACAVFFGALAANLKS